MLAWKKVVEKVGQWDCQMVALTAAYSAKTSVEALAAMMADKWVALKVAKRAELMVRE